MHSILIYKGDELLKTVNIAHQMAVSIGRNKLNDIHLPDPSSKVSRFHAGLFRDAEGRYSLQDLGSRNHTYVNGKRRDYGTLNDGDRIEIGEYILVFQEQPDKSKPEKSAVAFVDEGADDYAKTVLSPIPPPSEDIRRLKDDPDALLLLYQVSRMANLSPDLEESLQAVVTELANTFRPDRMFIALLEQEGASLTCLARFPLEDAEIKFSRTMLQHLLQEKQVLITKDALADERFQRHGVPVKSVLEQQIRSAVCVPLQWGGEIKGILYLDSSREDGRFTARDIKLLDLIGQDLSSLLERGLDYSAVRDEKLRLEGKLAIENTIIGISPKTKAILKTIERIAAADATILITGETGTGKDLVAKVIHQNSKRRGKPFIEVNCAAIPDNLLESELFGVIAHYPGFHNKEPLKGRFELANGGTIFLNEIGDLPERLQAKLLDVLETKRIWPLGKNQPVPVDIRIIAATNRDLQHEVREGRFREDLYERLNILRLHLPPLRERKEDIPLLAGYFLSKLREQHGKKISRLSNDCVEALDAYDWPRNVRELKNAIERAIILADRSVITPDLFDFKENAEAEPKSLAEVEREHIVKVLEYTKGNKGKAARILGITRETLYKRGREYKLPGFEGENQPTEHTEHTEGIK